MQPLNQNVFVPAVIFPLSVFLCVIAWPVVFLSAALGVALAFTALRRARHPAASGAPAEGWRDPSLLMRTGIALIAAPPVAVLLVAGGLTGVVG